MSVFDDTITLRLIEFDGYITSIRLSIINKAEVPDLFVGIEMSNIARIIYTFRSAFVEYLKYLDADKFYAYDNIDDFCHVGQPSNIIKEFVA